MNTIIAILAQAETSVPAAETTAPQGGGNMMIWVLVLMFVAMYFFMIAPQRKKQKQHEAMIKSLESGTDIITIGGIYGKITNKDDDTFTIKVDDGTKMKILKSAVARVIPAETPAETK